MLLLVTLLVRSSKLGVISLLGLSVALAAMGRNPQEKPASSPAVAQAQTPPSTSAPTGAAPTSLPGQTAPANPSAINSAPPPPRFGLSVVVLDPAHGGVDLGARGTEGVHESDVVLQFAVAVRQALVAQGFQVVVTREGNENPSYDDRSARANAQRGAVFISLHVASTGLAGTARVYVVPEIPLPDNPNGLIPWDRAQWPFVGLSHKLGDLVQAELAKHFKGSPLTAQVAPVRQLRTTAAPAIAVEVSSVSVENRADLDRMIPGVAEAIARGVAAFRPSYVVPVMPGTGGGTQP